MEIRSTHGRRIFFLRFYNKQGSKKNGKGKRRRIRTDIECDRVAAELPMRR